MVNRFIGLNELRLDLDLFFYAVILKRNWDYLSGLEEYLGLFCD